MRRVAGLLLLAVLNLTTGCDPGFTVRQVNARSQHKPGVTNVLPAVGLEIDTFHSLVGVGLFTPKLRVTNTTDSPIEVTGIQLVTGEGSFVDSSHRTVTYPFTVSPGATTEVQDWFNLPEGLQKTFKKPVELRLSYTIGHRRETVSASLVGKVQAAGEP